MTGNVAAMTSAPGRRGVAAPADAPRTRWRPCSREAVALLDEAGEPALTFRALAARLGGGVASIYWYVASKDELLDRATDQVMGRVLADTEQLVRAAQTRSPTCARSSLALFDPWSTGRGSAHFMLRNNGLSPTRCGCSIGWGSR